MKYNVCTVRLKFPLAKIRRPLVGAKMRQIPGIVSVSIGEKKMRLWYRGRLNIAKVERILLSQREKGEERKISMKEYRREALISLASFFAIEVVRKYFPGAFLGMKSFRSLLVLFIARNFIKNGSADFYREKRPNADTLTAVAVISSVLAGRPESSLTLLTLSNVAEMLTAYAAEKARKEISGLLDLNQRFVWRVKNGREEKVPVEEIKAGDIIAAHTGEKICVDGHVLEGDAAVNQSSITGESNPCMKKKGLPVYAGSVIEAGEILIAVEKVGEDTSLYHIVHLVEEAQEQKAPVQHFADKMATLLVPISFLGAAIVYGATRDWGRVLNLLFIDFSCGLKLSTATAISASIGTAAKYGILVKGGNYIEALSEADTLVLDKTGTLTVGIPQISSIKTKNGITEKELLLLAASAELHSVHPLAVAIQKCVEEKGWQVPPHKSSKTVIARGMEASIPPFENFRGGEVLVGSQKFMRERNVRGLDDFPTTVEANFLYIAKNGDLIGTLSISDPIRPQMKKTLNQMRRYGIDEIIMLTGDSKKVAEKVARKMDIDDYCAEVLPEDKADYVLKLKKHGRVMMVGDGINDAPALAFADVGVTLGGRQTDIAAESSAVTIRSDNPSRLMDAMRIARKTMALIEQNFTATIAVNSAAMIFGALGVITPLWSSIIHNTATLAVVLNSARITRFEPSRYHLREEKI